MAQHEAAFFAHYASLVNFVRQYAGRQSRETTYTLFEATPVGAHEDEAPRAWWLCADLVSMLHHRPQQRVSIEVQGDALTADRADVHPDWRVQARRQRATLLDLIGPQPLTRDQERPSHVVFWCDDEPTFQRLIKDNLALGCDRLQYATLQGEQPGQSAWLLRAERPSYFAIDVALSAARIKVYQPQDHLGLYCPWGSQHPLGDLVTQGLGSDALLFFRGLSTEAEALRLEAPGWKDVYQLTEFSLADLDTDESWEDRSGVARNFQVKLRLAPSHKLREASVWVLPGAEQPHLERLLHAIPEPDLDCLQFTLQEDQEGERFVLIRERHMGHGREYIDFEGWRLAPYAGYPNLLLPIDADLEPLLRKDRYRALFDLRHGRLTLLWRHEGRLRLVNVNERSFRPLTEMVDYIVGVGARDLKQIMAQAVFDFQDYRHAAPAPQSPAKKSGAPKRPPREESDEVIQTQAPTPTEAPSQEAAPQLAPVPRAQATQEREPDELERLEAELETQIIVKGQRADLWRRLAQIKGQQGKHHEAALCWQEALWLTGPGPDSQQLEREVIKALESTPEIGLAGLDTQQRTAKLSALIKKEDRSPEAVWLWVIYGARHLRQNPQERSVQSWLSQGHGLLERNAEALRKKERWYLWGQLIAQNQDEVAQVRVREGIMEELSARGLRPGEVPAFIANRIYQSRLLNELDEDTSEEMRAAMGILEHIEDTLRRSSDETVQRLSQAILSYGYERLGDKARSHERFGAAESIYNNNTSLRGADRAWIALYLGATCELREVGSGEAWLDTFGRQFKSSSNDGLNHSELNTLQESLLRRASSESPTDFLSPENFRSLFPEPQKYVRAQAIKMELEQLIQKGEFDRTLLRLQDMGQQVALRSDALGLQSRAQAWLLGYVVSALRRIGHTAEGVQILHNFETGAPDPSTDPMSGFYPILYRIKLGEGFMDVGEEQRGMDLVCQSVRMAWTAPKPLQWLDHLDMLSAALQAIESAPIKHRLEGVEQVLEAMFLDRPHPSGLDGDAYRAIKLRLLDHCVEVGLSKERLSLRRYKHYLDEDEFHIRQRIVNEKFTS